jgi:tRNA-specific 2-thiouridylase
MGPLFPAQRQDLPVGVPKTRSPDCLAGIRPILKSSFAVIRIRRTRSRDRCKAFYRKGFFTIRKNGGLIAKGSMPPPSQPAGAMLNSLDLEGRPQDTRIVVAMSGGVDSSATAALLKSEGYDVVGITLQLYDHGAATHRKGACCAGQDIHDARNVAERIGIPHYVLDYEDRFRESVIDNFADSYASGETPVPCIECNRSIKFRDLLKTARELGASALATGHYVASRRLSDGSRALTCAADADRDQSYFLFATTREQLDYLRFPLGDMTKSQARELARRFGLSVADKQDSQDICFVPTGRYTDIISRLRPNAIEPGDIVDLDGRVIGRHQGIVHFTVGQRRGLGIASSAPLYVVRLDAAGRRVVVGPREALRMDRIVLRDVNWIGDGALDRAVGEGLEIFVRVRSTRAPQPAWLRAADGGYEVELVAGEEGVSPGQACVFYDGPSGQARVLGGGFIQSATAKSTTAGVAARGSLAQPSLVEAMRG